MGKIDFQTQKFQRNLVEVLKRIERKLPNTNPENTTEELLPCPICGQPTVAIGSECYPKEGISVECTSDTCEFEIGITCTVRVDGLKEVAKKAHNIISNLITERESNENPEE